MEYHVPMCLWCGEREVNGKYTGPDGSGFCSSPCEEDARTSFPLSAGFVPKVMCDDPEADFPHELGTDGSCHTCAMSVEGDEPFDGFLTDAEADADVLASAGMGTDEDYGYFGDDCVDMDSY